jgi:hypothetical protein
MRGPRTAEDRHEKMLSKQISWPWFNSQTTWMYKMQPSAREILISRPQIKLWFKCKSQCARSTSSLSDAAAAGAKEISLARALQSLYYCQRATHNDRIMNCIHVINKRAYAGWEYGWLTDWLAGWLILVSAAFFFLPSISRYLSKFNLRVWPLWPGSFCARPKKKPYILAGDLQPPSREWSCTMLTFFASGPEDKIFVHEWIHTNELDKRSFYSHFCKHTSWSNNARPV